MLHRPTITELARSLLRHLYECSDGGSRALRLFANSTTAEAALEFASDNGWIVVEEDQEVSLTDAGRAVVKQSLS